MFLVLGSAKVRECVSLDVFKKGLACHCETSYLSIRLKACIVGRRRGKHFESQIVNFDFHQLLCLVNISYIL